ncbi:SOS response-associated peptidase family protein [Acidisphaera sp. S103]|uniref:SOS response-associated peptidase family protein n=1 Tax=Acidisphaera sp. S103 TaxID=1747223 RepID=UPI00131DA708|nr:SOS response-associated peptidase family protein [Acidisphaera sp. S103]
MDTTIINDLNLGDVGQAGGRGQVVRRNPNTGKRHMDLLDWGLRREMFDGQPDSPQPIRARAETVQTLRIFREVFAQKRGIAPATEIYLKQSVGGTGKLFAIRRADGQRMAQAAIWDTFARSDGTVVRTYCIVTVEASGDVAIHCMHHIQRPRMPRFRQCSPSGWQVHQRLSEDVRM